MENFISCVHAKSILCCTSLKEKYDPIPTSSEFFWFLSETVRQKQLTGPWSWGSMFCPPVIRRLRRERHKKRIDAKCSVFQ